MEDLKRYFVAKKKMANGGVWTKRFSCTKDDPKIAQLITEGFQVVETDLNSKYWLGSNFLTDNNV